MSLYLKLTSQTDQIWNLLEGSPEPLVRCCGGGTHLQVFCGELSFEKRLPGLKRGGLLSVFRTVEALIEGYNLLVTQKMGPEFVRTLGGFDEGLLEVSMMFDAIVQGYQRQQGSLIPPHQLEAAMANSYQNLPVLVRLNYFPQKIFDELIVADINPFAMAGSARKGMVRADVRAPVWDFLEKLGGELFASPSAQALRLRHRVLFEHVSDRMHQTVCGRDEWGRQLQDLMLELFEKVAGSLQTKPDPGNIEEAIPFLQQVALRLSRTRIQTFRPPYTQADALMVLQRTTCVLRILLLFVSYLDCPENRFTIGCTAFRAGILKRWYTRLTSVLMRWYQIEYERQTRGQE